MAVFAYQGTGDRGEKRAGEVEAPSRSEALRRLAMDRIQPLTLVAKAAGAPVSTKTTKEHTGVAGRVRREAVHRTGGIHLSNAQVILFTDELSDFLHSGLQLGTGAAIDGKSRRAFAGQGRGGFSAGEGPSDGTSFSEALKIASPNFDELYCNLVAAGEVSGALAPLLRRQATHLVDMQELRGRVKLALIYPGPHWALAGSGERWLFS